MASYIYMEPTIHTPAVSHVKILESTSSTVPFEVPLEKDGIILLSALTSQHPDAIGLRYWSDSCTWVTLTAKNNVIYPPREGWGTVYYHLDFGPEKIIEPNQRINEKKPGSHFAAVREEVSYVKIWENTSSTTVPIEIPLDEDGTLLLSTLISQYPKATGLRYLSNTGTWRALQVKKESIYPPPQGWEGLDCYLVLSPEVKDLSRNVQGNREDKIEQQYPLDTGARYVQY